jgi:hypothetical protein
MSEATTPIVFRVWNAAPKDVFALFPTDPADNYGHYCTSYQHIGQHSSADYQGCIYNSRPATAAEAAPLLRELVGRGYLPRVIHRATRKHHDTRRKMAGV